MPRACTEHIFKVTVILFSNISCSISQWLERIWPFPCDPSLITQVLNHKQNAWNKKRLLMNFSFPCPLVPVGWPEVTLVDPTTETLSQLSNNYSRGNEYFVMRCKQTYPSLPWKVAFFLLCIMNSEYNTNGSNL